MDDLRFAIRQLGKRPGFTAVAVITLTLGIGANTAIFSVIYGSWLRPLPFPDPDRLAWIGEQERGSTRPLAPANYLDLEASSRSFVAMAAYTPAEFTIADGSWATRVEGVRTTPELFQVLGLGPRLGRGFAPEDGAQGAPAVVVLSHRLWRDRFGADPEIVGRTVRVDAVQYTVAGVTPAEFSIRTNPYLPGEAQVFVPLRWTARDRENHGGRWIFAVGRLAPGATPASAERELGRLFEGIKELHPQMPQDVSASVRELRPVLVGRDHTSLLMLGGAALLVLLVACVNVANLLLARSETRTRELAVRAALGAGRGRLARTFLSEGLLLALLGGLTGVAVAFWGVDLLLGLYGGTLPRASQIAVRAEVLGFALALATATGVIVSLPPALLIDPRRLSDDLRATGPGAIGSRSRLRGALVVSEVAMTAVLVAGAGLLIHSFVRLSRVEPGLNRDHALVFRVSLPEARYQDRASVMGFHDSLLEGLRAMPGVQNVGAIDRDMFKGGFNLSTLTAVDAPDLEATFVEYRQVTPGFFAAAGIPLLEGRMLATSPGESGNLAVLISRELARQLFPDRDPLGERLDIDWLGDPEIIGVVGDVRELGPSRESPPRFYWWDPDGYARRSTTLLVRTNGDPLSLAPRVRQVVARLDSEVPVYDIASLRELVARSFGNRWLVLSLLAIFAGVTLLLAAVGVYGVISYTVASRTREVGVRLALGAEAVRVQRMVLTEGFRLAALGVAIGLAIAVALGHVLRGLLWEVSPSDPVTLVGVTVLLLSTASASAFLPARRAARTDPMEALRAE